MKSAESESMSTSRSGETYLTLYQELILMMDASKFERDIRMPILKEVPMIYDAEEAKKALDCCSTIIEFVRVTYHEESDTIKEEREKESPKKG